MAIPITIKRLLSENIVEWARIEFKVGWNPDKILMISGKKKEDAPKQRLKI